MTKQELQNQLQDKALKAVGELFNVGLDIATGGGKTFLGLKHMAKQFTENSMFLIVAPKKSIFQEWINNATEHKYEFLIPRMKFSTYRSLQKQNLDYDWVYLDECHNLKFNHKDWLDDYSTNGKILGLTGTYPKAGEKLLMCQEFCRNVFTMDLNNAIGTGLLNNYKIFVHLMNLNQRRILKQTSSKGKVWMTSEIKDYSFWTDALEETTEFSSKNKLRVIRMKKMQSYRTKTEYVKHILNKIDYKTLIFATSKEQAEEICKHSYHSGNSDKQNQKVLEQFDHGLIYRMSAIDQISEGKSIKDLKVGIIMHSYSSDVKSRQKIGRFLRLSPEEVATIHILCYEDTVDLQWVKSALKSFNPSRIKVFKTNFKIK